MTLGRKGLSVLIVMMMLFSSFMVMIPANMDGWNSDGVPDNILDGATEESGLADITSAADGQSPVNGPAKKAKGMMKVYVATNDVKELADFLSDYEFKGALGDKNNVRDEIAFLLLEIPIKALGTIMDLEGVIGVYEYMAPEYSSLEVEKIQSLLKKSPNFLQTLSAASEPAAWTGGYSGADVKIAVCDSGVDFAHPDLLGAYAKDTMIFEVDGEVLIESAGDGQTRIMVHSAVIEVNNETLVADAVGGEQEIPVRYKNIVDGTVSVYIDSNTTGFTVDISTGFITLTNPLNAGEELSTSYDYYFVQRNLVPGSYTVYKEGTAMTSGYTLDTSSGELTFSPALAAGDEISIDYDYYSPYYNWPIAFDPVSMDTYIASQGNPDNTFYANTSISGTGPFQSSHTIAIDGVSDFSAEEALGGEKLLSSETILSRNFDLQNLYVTRDPNNWYFGFPTRHGLTDKSYSIYIDVDGANSGGNFDPRGNLVDTNSSHSDEVNDVLYTLDDNYIISASTDKSLKIWDANSGIMISKLTGTELWGRSVKSIDISVNGTWLAGSDGATLIIWDITDIANPVLFKSFAIGGGSQSFPNSIISFSNDGEYMAIGDFGGYSFSVFLLDLITNTWLGPIVPATRPSARSGHAMVYESFGNLSVLFGGDDGALDNETWEYDADADTWIQTTGIVNPSERSGHAMAYDSDEKKIIMFGGNDGAFDNETWEYDVVTNTWTDVSGIVAPSPRSGHSMCYDSSKDKIILFGGTDAGGENDETWEYDVATRTWVNTGVTGPSARSGHAMAFEPELGFTVLFGGTDAGGENGETWKYKTGWINVTDNEGPSARSGHSMCYDSSLRVDKIVLFGGDDGDANGETWEMDISNTWTQVTKAAAPGARSGHAMAYDVINDVSVVFGGNDGALDSETWEYNSADNKAYSVGDVVTSIGFSPDGTILAAGTGKKEINLIEMATGNIEKLQGHTGDVTALAWSPGGTKIVSGAYDGEVKQWNLATKLSYNNITDHIGTINSVDWSSDGTKIITAGEDNYVRMYNAVAPYTMTSDNQGDSPINSVNFSSMGSYVSGSVDSKVGAWTSSGAYVRSFLANLPDYVIVVDYIRERSDYWSVDADGIVSSRNDTIENATFYTWNGASSSWDELNLMNETIGGEQAYRSFLDATNLKIENAFVDLLVPRDLFAGDPDMLEAEIFVTAKMGHVTDEVVITATGATATLEHNKVYPSMEYAMFRSYDLFLDDAASTILKEGVDYTLDLETGVITFTPPLNAGDTVLASYYYYKDVSHAQDTAPNDNNVPTTNVDWSDTVTSLSNFGKREILYYTVDLADVSLSGAYKFGFHPGDAQINRFGALGILVVDDNTKGVYEKVYVDLNNDKVFDNNDRAVYLGDETTDGDETTSIDIPSLGVLDGIADYSAGTLYFIADGMTPIPYSEVFSERHGVLDRHSLENWTEWRNAYVPKAGELVCLSGEFGYDEYDGIVLTHGTKSAAVIAGRGNPAIPKNTLGMAPNATIIPISNIDQEGNIFDAWYFAVEGYDGVPGTGDEAVIVNNGFNYPDIYEDGWDPYSHYADYISTEYAGGRTLFVSGVGNDGYGYGTLASPGACPGVLSVGSATDYYFKTQKGVDDEGNYPHSGDVAFYSSKGPSTLGIPKPDVIAIGTGVTDVALSGDGTDAYRGYNDPWVGSDYSCAAAVGVLGMVYEAYYDTTHAADAEVLLTPDNTTTITLKHSPVIADSLTLQINGTTTTDYSINLMNGVITFNNVILKDRWVNATVYQFYNEYPDAQTARSLLMSGADDMKNDVLSQGAGLINAENSIKMAERTDGLLVNPSSWVPGNFTGEEYESFVKLMAPGDKESQEFTIENRNGTVAADVDIDDGTFKKIGEYNEVFQHMVPGTLDFFKYIDILDKIPPSTELLKITAHASFEELDKNNDGILDPVPDLITDACTDFIYDMSVMDWTDLGADGEFDPTDYDEGNTFDTCDLLSNVLQVRVKDPLVRSHDGLFVKISPKGVMPVPGASEVYFIHWTICCEFYTKTDWDWLSLDQTSMTITEGTESTLTATISVPDNAEIGSYEGAIYLYEDQQPVVGELLADYPKYSASEELENISVTNNVVGETLTNSTSTLAHMNPYVTGTPSIKKIVTSPIPVVNESVFVATDPVGNETFNVGYTNILDYNLWVEEAGTLWWDLNPFVASFDLLTGDVVLSTGVGDTCTVYAWLNHTAVELTTPGDFTFVRDTGDVTLVSGPLIAGEYLIADYSYIGPPQFDVMDENVVNSTPSITHLANTYVVDTPANSPTIWKKTRPTEIVNQSVWVDGTVGETFNVGYTDILDYNLWVDDGTWWVLNPHLTSFDLATGDVVIDGWDLWAGCEVFAWLNLTPASPPVELTPSEYTLHPGNGTIVLDVPLLVAEYLTANYSYIRLETYNGVQLARGAGDESILGIDIYVNYTDLLTEGVGMDYTIDRETGYVTFTPAVVVRTMTTSYEWYDVMDIPIAKTENYVIKDGTWTIYNNGVPMTEYTMHPTTGILIFDEPLSPGDLITADYTYYGHVQTIPIMVNIPATKADFTFGGQTSFTVIDELVTDVDTTKIVGDNILVVNIYDVTRETVSTVPINTVPYEFVVQNYQIDLKNELLLFSTGVETEAEMAEVNPTKDNVISCTVYADGVPLTSDNYTWYVSGLIVFNGSYSPLQPGLTITTDYSYYNAKLDYRFLEHGSATNDRIVPGSHTFYMNGTPMLGNTEYNGFWDANSNYPTLSDATGNNEWYTVIVGGTQNLGSGPISFAIGDVVLHDGNRYWKNPQNYTSTDVETGKVVFYEDLYVPEPFDFWTSIGSYVPLDAVITADYSYYTKTNTANLDFVDFSEVDNVAVVPGSCVLMNG
ncbi:MAG: S8 family serine peptidase, partial [Thermoplasmata archaeon]|nr:S8 family serine peptidase [Thermoplasmata archaeon]